MPNPQAFLRGFQVHQGLQLDGYTLSHINIRHHEVTRYQYYTFPMLLTFTVASASSAPPEVLLRDFQNLVAGDRVINSAYGNPYRCSFGLLRIQSVNQGTVTLASEGTGERI